jgi:hypothetical protein
VLLSACGGTTKDSSTFESGVPPDEALSGLNQGDQARLCSSLLGYLRDNKDTICKYAGYLAAALAAGFDGARTDADVQSKCADTVARCEVDPVEDAGPSACQPLDVPSDCPATVRQYEGCVTEELTQLHDAASRLPACSELTLAHFQMQASTGGDNIEQGSSPTCQALQNRCPGQFENGPIGGSSSATGSSSDVGGSVSQSRPDAGSAPSRCGNGVIDPPEGCDDTDLGGQTCASLTMGAHPTGTLRCTPYCQFDASNCI